MMSSSRLTVAEVFEQLGYQACLDDSREPGFERVTLYVGITWQIHPCSQATAVSVMDQQIGQAGRHRTFHIASLGGTRIRNSRDNPQEAHYQVKAGA